MIMPESTFELLENYLFLNKYHFNKKNSPEPCGFEEFFTDADRSGRFRRRTPEPSCFNKAWPTSAPLELN